MSAAIFRAEPVAREELDEVDAEATTLRSHGGSAIRLLAGTRYSEWPALADHPELQHPGALEELSGAVVERIHRAPLESLTIANLAATIADALPSGTAPDVVRAQLRARAWKDLGLALRHVARQEEALSAFGRAEEILAPHPGLVHDLAVLQLARASMLQEVNRFEESEADLLRCKPVFEEYGDRRRQLLCGIYEGSLLHRLGRYREAIDVYLPLLDVAREIGDFDAVGSIENNIGHSATESGDYALAERHLDEAVALFTKLRMPLAVARAELARGRMLVRKGEVARGVALLHSVRGEFLQHRLVEEAGLAGLDIVEAHLARGATVEGEALAREIIREFTAAQLNARAITALAYLSETIAARKASRATVENVREFIRRLRTQPEAEFAATA